MTLLTGRKQTGTAGLAQRLEALDRVIELGHGRLDDVDPDVVARAEAVAGKAGQRLRFGEGYTVVALAGATGSGKSSLFNALAGEPVSTVGLRRPTTGVAHSVIWGAPEAGALLDWLEVPHRHRLTSPEPALEGLVLLDLPDVDSVEARHRLVADRLVERVDLLVWVLDPQKYADAAVHKYLVRLGGHADVMVVALNQVDRLSGPAREGCLSDLGRLLGSEGLGAVPVIPTSATTGEGLDDLRAELTRRVAAKRASVRRLEADLSALGLDLSGAFGVQDGRAVEGVRAARREELVTALSDAAGADLVAEAVGANHRLRARRATGWPVTRWTARLRRDPARRLRLRETPSDLVRTALPGPSPTQRARIDAALRDLARDAAEGLEEPWPTLVRRAATGSVAELPDRLDRAVAGTDLGLDRRPFWWRAVGLLQYLLVAAAVTGLVWLGALFAVAWLQLPDPPLPHWGPVPVPTVLLIAGVAAGVLLALLSAVLARVGARRSAARARRRVAERVRGLAQEAVIDPVERELGVHQELGSALTLVRG
jgi:energy-coupling factor transporter ATP-binding protein EcfA2